MSKSDTFENGLLLLLFNNTDIANIGDAAGLQNSVGAGDLYLGMHTGAGPLDAGDAETLETAYTGYARVSIARASGAGGFTVTGNSVSPTDDTDFGECTAAPGADLTFFGLSSGTDGVGPETILYYGTLTPDIAMATGVIPRFKNTSTITED